MVSVANISNERIPVLRLPCEPLFVVGMNGSGTSMLAESLGRHPELYANPQETRVIPHLIKNLHRFGDLEIDENFLRLWDTINRIPAFSMMNNGRPPPIPANWQDFPRNLASILDAVFRYLAAKRGKQRWGEKTPQHIQHLNRLHGIFPAAKFVHIIRDGRDCAASFHRRWRRTPELTVYRWKQVVKAGREQGASLGDQYLEIRYEDLTTNPEQWMRQVCQFLDLPFHENVLSSRRPQSGSNDPDGKIEPNNEKWRQYFNKDQLISLESIAGRYLKELDYPVCYDAGDRNPSRVQINFWRAKDYSKQLISAVTIKLQGQSNKSWRHIYGEAIAAWQQWRSNRF